MSDFLEWSLLRNWVKQWLSYSKWYYITALSPDVTLGAFFDAPMVEVDWKRRPDRSEELIRFGLMWKVYDIV